jgi:hypothetical protein
MRGIVIFCYLIVAALLYFCMYLAFPAINEHLAETDGIVEYKIIPHGVIWWIPSLYGALFISNWLTVRVWAVFGGSKIVSQYLEWMNEQTRRRFRIKSFINSPVFARRFNLAVGFLFCLVPVLALNMHSVLGPDAIRDCGYAFTSCKVYPYADAQRITFVQGIRNRNGNFVLRDGYVVDFKDGRRWFSADMYGAKNTWDVSLDNLLTRKTNLSDDYYLTEQDIPPLAGQSPLSAK